MKELAEKAEAAEDKALERELALVSASQDDKEEEVKEEKNGGPKATAGGAVRWGQRCKLDPSLKAPSFKL